MSFWQNVIDKRTEIEVRKKELQLQAQTGVRTHPFLGDVIPSIKSTYHSITKYPRMLVAGFAGTSGDQTVDMPSLPRTFEGTDLAADLSRKRDEAQKRIDEEKKAYTRLFVEGDAGLWERYKEYHQHKSTAKHNQFRENLTVPVQASLAATALGTVATGVAKSLARSGVRGEDITHALSSANLGSLSPSSWFGGVTETVSAALT